MSLAAALQRKLTSLEEEVNRLDQQIETREAQKRRLADHIQLLKTLLAEDSDTAPATDAVERPDVVQPHLNGHTKQIEFKALTPARAVRQFLRENPGSQRIWVIKKVAQMDLESTVPVADQGRRQSLVASVLKQLVRRESVVRDDAKRYFINDKKEIGSGET